MIIHLTSSCGEILSDNKNVLVVTYKFKRSMFLKIEGDF